MTVAMDDIIKVCVRCGVIYTASELFAHYNDLYCNKCMRMRGVVRSKIKAAERRAKGIIPESKRRSGRRAYHTRLARLYFKDKERFKRLYEALRLRSSGRAGAVTRIINQIK